MLPETPKLTYILRIEAPQTHYLEVEILLNLPGLALSADYTELKMPVWTPGSYLVREYAKNVEGFRAWQTNGQGPASSGKLIKITWRIFGAKDRLVRISYQVYAFELSVRHSFADASHAYVNGASVFMYLAEHPQLAALLHIQPPAGWMKMTTSLKAWQSNPWELYIPNYDTLVDSPIEVGNHDHFTFMAADIPHQVAVYGLEAAHYDQARLIRDFQAIVEASLAIFGQHPSADYTFIVHFMAQGGGGWSTGIRAAFSSPGKCL
ncbi:MAG: hypothetical protein HC880_14260 [Bacteroidia bacterium]|nr:hypothetical protein [Bacteroidia bacterium]